MIETKDKDYLINYIEENNLLDLLDDRTKEVITYRKKYPDLSLVELSDVISLETGIPISKSGLNHRFRKIHELAEKLRNQ